MLDKLYPVAVHQQQSLLELHPLAAAEEEEQDMGLQDREGVGHLDQGAGQVVVAQAAAVVAEGEPQLPVVGVEADLINRK